MSQSLRNYPTAQAQAFIKSVCKLRDTGELDEAAYSRFCQQVLEDRRLELHVLLAQSVALPEGGAMDLLAPDEHNPLLDKLRDDLPGLMRYLTPRGKSKDTHADEEGTPAFLDGAVSLLARMQAAYPLWYALTQHSDAQVRLAAIARIPEAGNPLSITLALYAGDTSTLVRAQVRLKLGLPTKRNRTSWRDYQRGIMRAKDAVMEASSPFVSDERRDALLVDPRTRVRVAAALTLRADSPRWLTLATDASPRLRRLAAERVPLDTPAFKSCMGDENSGVKTVALKRYAKAYDESMMPVSKAVAERKAWKAKIDAWEPKEQP